MAATTKPSTLVVYLSGKPTTPSGYDDILTKLASEGQVHTAESKEAALDILSNPTQATTRILVLDGALANEENLDLARRLVDFAWGGATVILGGSFSSAEPSRMMELLDRTWGLPWAYEGKRREETRLNGDAVTVAVAERGGLLEKYTQEAVFVRNVERDAGWYETEDGGAAATVLMPFGEGKVGYVGDVNGEEGTVRSVLAMFGVAA